MMLRLSGIKSASRLNSRNIVSITGIRLQNPGISGVKSLQYGQANFSTIFPKPLNPFTSFCDSTTSGSNIDPSGAGVDPSTISDIVSTISASAVSADAASIPALGTNPTHYVMMMIENAHHLTGLPYWETIIGITIVLRIMLLPIAIKSVLNGARMGALRPDMQKVQEAFKNDPHAGETSVKIKYQKEMQALFVKHKVNPFQAILMPMVQLPIFLSFYFALTKMGDYFPALKTGGAFWFYDLTAPDAFYILPIVNGISFLVMVEIGADGMQSQENKQQMDFMKQVMRGMGILIVPLTATVPEVITQ
jgi:YidC/Oxa1 family membrane protein insertase